MKEWIVTITTEDYVEKHNLKYKLSAIEGQIGVVSIEVDEVLK